MGTGYAHAVYSTILNVFLPEIKNEHIMGTGTSQTITSIYKFPVNCSKLKIASQVMAEKFATKGGNQRDLVHPTGPVCAYVVAPRRRH